MRVLGIDPGFDRVGVAVLDKNHPKQKIVFSTCIETDKKLEKEKRVFFILEKIKEILEIYKPDIIAIEKLFFAKNKKTALDVAEMKGALKEVLLENNKIFEEITPNEIKMCITGQGNADKKQIKKMIKYSVLIDNTDKMLDDEIDAIAIGVCCILNKK